MTTRPFIFQLLPGDRLTPLWPRLMAMFRDELRIRREKNDTNLDELETAKIRGEIALLKAFIDLDQDRTPEGDI